MRDMPHVMGRIFGAALMIHEGKLNAIVAGLAPRFGVRPMAFEEDDYAAQTVPQTRRRPYEITASGVAVIPVVGVLVNRAGRVDGMSMPLRSYSAIVGDLQMALADPAVRGVVLDIDSPGGEASGAFEAAAAIHAMRGSKPIVAVANGHAYSAAYLLASAADVVLLPNSGGVGSVGVVALHIDQSGADAKDGLAFEYVHAGARKIDGNPHAPLTDEARAGMTAEVARLYGTFVDGVALYRSIAADAVRATEAACLYGDAAVTAGLANAIGTKDDAIAEVVRRTSSTRTGRSSVRAPQSTRIERMDPEEQARQDAAVAAALAAANETAALTAAAAVAAMAEEASAVVELCTMAGRPQDAAAHIKAGRSRGEVSEALLRARADTQAPIVSAHGVLGSGAEANAGGDDPHDWDKSIARTCGSVKKEA